MAHLASLEGIRVELGGRPVLADLDFELSAGQVAGVTGSNGSGKTTLLRTLATLTRLDGGHGEVLGCDVTGDRVLDVRRSIGLIGHSPTALLHLTLRENLEHVARLTGIESSRVEVALHAVGLEEVADRRAVAGSFGMMRRLEVARLLLTRPRLLLLDEATSGLDSAAGQLVAALIERTTAVGGGVVMVSHDTRLLADHCEVVHELRHGRFGGQP